MNNSDFTVDMAEALAGVRIEGVMLERMVTFTEMDQRLTEEQGYGGTFAVGIESLSIPSIMEARREHRARFAEALAV